MKFTFFFPQYSAILEKVPIVIFGKMEMIYLTISVWKNNKHCFSTVDSRNWIIKSIYSQVLLRSWQLLPWHSKVGNLSIRGRSVGYALHNRKEENPLNAVSFLSYLTGTRRFYYFFVLFVFVSFLWLICFLILLFHFNLFLLRVVCCLYVNSSVLVSHLAFIYMKRTSAFRKFRLLQ